MEQNPIQSNLPEFGQSSMTSEHLYQHPEKSVAKEIASNLAAWMLLFSIFMGLALMAGYAADKESAYQAEAIAKSVGGAK